MCEEALNFTAEMAGNIPAEMAGNIPGGRRVHNSFIVERTARDFDASLISPLPGSKDQQSMVLTSKGPRGQKMELSVRTAIKFYFVQDMLGFDQPSQAVEWLLEKSEAAIRELPQPSSISTSQISQYVESNRAAVSSSRVETGDENTSQDDTFGDNDNRQRNLHEQVLAARTFRGQRSSTAKTTKSNKDSIGQGEKREQRSMAMRSAASNRRTREAANVVPPKEFRAKARERCRQRTKPKDKTYNKQSGISGISQKSSMRLHYPTFCLQENTTPPSSMTNLSTDANSSSNAQCLHGLMLPEDSNPCNQTRRCVSSPPAEMECSSHPSVHYSAPDRQEGSSTQSTGAFSKNLSSNI